MLGKRESQRTLFDVGNVFDLSLNQRSFHYQLAVAAGKLFKDEDFGDFCDEAIQRTAYDLRWAAVLRRHAGQPLCAKSTLQLFRSHLVLHDRVLRIFLSSINEAKRAGLLKGKALQIAVDTKPIRGRGAVEDTSPR